METSDWLTQARKGVIELCILALLAERQRYGYDIVQELNTPGQVVIAEGTIYPLLKRLSADGLLASEWRESSSGPPRKYYRLTEKGLAYLHQIAGQWQGFSAFVNRLVGGVLNERPESEISEAGGRVPDSPPPKPLRIDRRREE